MKLKAKTYFDIFWVIFFGGIFITALFLEFEAALIPLLVSGLCFIFAVSNLIIGLVRTGGKAAAAAETPSGLELHKKKKQKVDPRVAQCRFFVISSWLVGFVVGTYLFGHYAAIPLFTFLFLKSRKEGWVMSATFAVVLFAGVYFAIVVGVKTPLYEGLLPALLLGE
ncbi:MAG TPA: hypothetical protein VKF36_15405 [Syntrophorhabdales bacterium]|nr:hypothetical protein [Syntrophorhabdales bacterium]